MTFTKAIAAIILVYGLNIVFGFAGLYGSIEQLDIFMHLAGGFAMGMLGIAIWHEGVADIRFKGRMARHLRWWLVPVFVLGFVALVGIAWEWHEFLLDQFFAGAHVRQPGIGDTMADFFFDLLGAGASILIFLKKKKTAYGM